MEALQTAYEESHAKAVESIEGQLGLFNDLDGTAKTSIDSLIETLKGQVSYMETYAANIQKAMELGVDEGLVKKLADGSEESAQILAAIVEGGEDEIAALNEQLAKVEEGKNAFGDTVAEMETDFSEKMADIEKRMKDCVDELDISVEAGAAGAATIEGYIEGAESMRSSLVSTYRSLARAANNAYKSTLDIHSPSRVFRDDGRNTILGAIEGGEDMRSQLERTYESLAKSAIRAYERGATERHRGRRRRRPAEADRRGRRRGHRESGRRGLDLSIPYRENGSPGRPGRRARGPRALLHDGAGKKIERRR